MPVKAVDDGLLEIDGGLDGADHMATSSTPMMVPMKLAEETRSLSSFSRCYPVVL